MSPTAIQPPISQPQRPWRATAPVQTRAAGGMIVRPFAAPIVRELPPRRETRAAAGAW